MKSVSLAGAHSRGIKGALARTRVHGPSEYSPPPRRGCPFHQGTTAEAAARPVVRSPRRSHSHIKLRPHSDRRPRTPPQATADQRRSGACGTRTRTRQATRADAATHQHQYHHHHHQNQQSSSTSSSESTSSSTTDSVAGSLLPSFIRLYWAPQQTRWPGASYPVSFDSTGHPQTQGDDDERGN